MQPIIIKADELQAEIRARGDGRFAVVFRDTDSGEIFGGTVHVRPDEADAVRFVKTRLGL